jgi:hypothetical protein
VCVCVCVCVCVYVCEVCMGDSLRDEVTGARWSA